MSRCAPAILVFVLVTGGLAAQPEVAPEPPAARTASKRDQLTDMIRRWLDRADPAARDRLLRGLRTLRDASLRPLFGRLALSNDPGLRRHGILGSAELDPGGEVDLLAIGKISDPRERTQTLVEAMSEDLVTVDQLQEVLRWEGLQDDVCAQVACRLAAAGKPIPHEIVDRLLATSPPAVRLRVAVCVMQAIESPAAVAAINEATAALVAQPGGREAVQGVLADVRRDGLWKGGIEFSRRVLGVAKDDAVLRFEAIATLLACLPTDEQATRECLAALGNKADLGGRLMTSLAVLEASLAREQASPELVAGMLEDADPMIRQMGDALQAILAGCGSAPAALEALARNGHAPTAAWALRAAKRRAWQDAVGIRLDVVQSINAKSSREMLELGAQAARELCDDDPSALNKPLSAALTAGEIRRVQVILLGAAGSRHARACDALPSAEPAWPDDVSSALAAVLRARCAEPNDAHAQERFETLSAVAAGRGNLSPVLRFLAAWQALRAVGDDRATLARVLSGD